MVRSAANEMASGRLLRARDHSRTTLAAKMIRAIPRPLSSGMHGEMSKVIIIN